MFVVPTVWYKRIITHMCYCVKGFSDQFPPIFQIVSNLVCNVLACFNMCYNIAQYLSSYSDRGATSMSILNRFRPVRPTYSTKVVTPEQIKAPEPITPIPTEMPEDMQRCAACGVIGAKTPLPPVSYFGYVKLPYIVLCEACHTAYIEASCNHHFRQRKEWPNTVARMAAIEVAKQRSTITAKE